MSPTSSCRPSSSTLHVVSISCACTEDDAISTTAQMTEQICHKQNTCMLFNNLSLNALKNWGMNNGKKCLVEEIDIHLLSTVRLCFYSRIRQIPYSDWDHAAGLPE